jgi:hypothetical protein
VKDDFSVNVISQPICKDKCKDCEIIEPLELSSELLEKYQTGEIIDSDLITQHLEWLRTDYRRLSKNIYIFDNQCYGTNLKAAIKALTPTTLERKALWTVLNKVNESVIFDKATPSKILGYYWKDFGKNAIFAITHDTKIAKGVFKKFDINKIKASEILKEADVEIKKKTIISLGGDTKVKSVAYAFLLALKRGEGKKWQYTQTEHDFAQYLKNVANQLLQSEPDEYHDALQNLLSATGSTEKIDKN